MMTFSVPNPRPALRRTLPTGLQLPGFTRRDTPESVIGPRIARSTFVPLNPRQEPRTA